MINHKHSLSTFCIIFLFSLLYFNLTIAISDVTGPEVSDFVLEENTKTLTVGDTIHVSAKITDESEIRSA